MTKPRKWSDEDVLRIVNHEKTDDEFAEEFGVTRKRIASVRYESRYRNKVRGTRVGVVNSHLISWIQKNYDGVIMRSDEL